MKIWVDADACPNVIKTILYRASERTKTEAIFVANQFLIIPGSQFIRFIQVSSGFDVADNYIVQHCIAGDLVITADIPLASQVMKKNAQALNPRGELYSQETMQQRLAMRDFMESMRSVGQVSGGPPPLSKVDTQAFANALDKFLMKK